MNDLRVRLSSMTGLYRIGLILLLGIYTTHAFSQEQTVTIMPNIDAGIRTGYVKGVEQSDVNIGNYTYISLTKWTLDGQWYTDRSLMKFDVSQIPSDAIITEASLELKAYLTQPLERSNESEVHLLLGAWTEFGVTWNNQPAYDPDVKAYLPGSTEPAQDYIVNIKDMVQGWVSGYYHNYGLLLKLKDEDTQLRTRMVFGASDNKTASLRPVVTIKYIIPNKVTIHPDKDANVKIQFGNRNNVATTNFGSASNFAAEEWTTMGYWHNTRALIQFDLSSIPEGVEIVGAKLRLTGTAHDKSGKSNVSQMHRVTTEWLENTVTWVTQPSYVEDGNSIDLRESNSATEVYNIDVKHLVQGWYSGQYDNYGLLMKLKYEALGKNPAYARLYFQSSDNPPTSSLPTLEVYYTVPLEAHYELKHENGFEGKSVDLTVAGGEAPYYVLFSNEDLMNLSEYTTYIDTTIGLDSLDVPIDTAYFKYLSKYENRGTYDLNYGLHRVKVYDTDFQKLMGVINVIDTIAVDTTGVEVYPDGSFTKTAPDGWGNAAITYAYIFSAGINSYHDMIFGNNTNIMAAGLRDIKNSQILNASNIAYGFRQLGDGTFDLVHAGQIVKNYDITSGDVLRIGNRVLQDGTNEIYYMQNGEELHAATNTLTEDYCIDMPLYSIMIADPCNLQSEGSMSIDCEDEDENPMGAPSLNLEVEAQHSNYCNNNAGLNVSISSAMSVNTMTITSVYDDSFTPITVNSDFTTHQVDNLPKGRYELFIDYDYNFGGVTFNHTKSKTIFLGTSPNWSLMNNTNEVTGGYLSLKELITSVPGGDAMVQAYLPENEAGFVGLQFDPEDNSDDLCEYSYYRIILSTADQEDYMIYTDRVYYVEVEFHGGAGGLHTTYVDGNFYTLSPEDQGIESSYNFPQREGEWVSLVAERGADGIISFYRDGVLVDQSSEVYNGELLVTYEIIDNGCPSYLNLQGELDAYPITSLECFNTYKMYSHLQQNFDDSYSMSDGVELNFLYNEEYVTNGTTLNYNIYKLDGSGVGTLLMSSADQTIELSYGINKISLILNANFSPDHFYLLEVIGQKGFKQYLKFYFPG